jgi:hypothetical protein
MGAAASRRFAVKIKQALTAEEAEGTEETGNEEKQQIG